MAQSARPLFTGLLELGGPVRVKREGNTQKRTLQSDIRENVVPGAAVYIDIDHAHHGLDAERW